MLRKTFEGSRAGSRGRPVQAPSLCLHLGHKRSGCRPHAAGCREGHVRKSPKSLELQVVCSCSQEQRLAWPEVQLLLCSLESDRDARLDPSSPLHYLHQIGLWAGSLSPLKHPISLAPACYRGVREALSLFQPANFFFCHSGSLSGNETQLTLDFRVF